MITHAAHHFIVLVLPLSECLAQPALCSSCLTGQTLAVIRDLLCLSNLETLQTSLVVLVVLSLPCFHAKMTSAVIKL